MVAGNSMFQSRRFYLSLLGVVAWSATAADSVLDIIDASSLSAVHSPLFGLAATASALDLVALGAVTVFSAQYAWTRDGIIKDSPKGKKIIAISCALLSAGALVVSLASMISTRIRGRDLGHKPMDHTISDWDKGSAVHVAIWILACIGQIILFSSPLWIRSKQQVLPVAVSGPRDSVMSEMRYSAPTSNVYMLHPTDPSSPLAALPSPTMSNHSSQSLRSWRDSLQQIVRPVTSRSRLVNRPSFNREVASVHSDGLSVKSVSQPDGFDSWEVDTQIKETVTQLASPTLSGPSRGTALEPIPGSRPASPARPLDGPFPMADKPDELQPPPKLALDAGRPPSPVVSEGHIHPLFRSESPTPPPVATPGTSIIASPLASQVITCPPRPYSRMRSNSSRSHSRAASPALVHQRSFISEREVSRLSQRSQSRSPSPPPSRQMTPPIPDFVLNSSPRSSVSGSRRKVSLHTETNR